MRDKRMSSGRTARWASALSLWLAVACATPRAYENRDMDFGAIHTVAVMPFNNLTSDQHAAERVRDVFLNTLLASRALYVLPPGEVGRAVSRLGIATPTTPTGDDVVKLGGHLKVDAIFTGVVKEYGEVRGTPASANAVSLSVQMRETGSGKVVWAASSTKGGTTWGTRLLGSTGGRPLNDVTEQAVDDVLEHLFQ